MIQAAVMRNFLMENRLAVSAGQGNLTLTDNGKAFFRGWLEGALPQQYQIDTNFDENPAENMHAHAMHAHADGRGGGFGQLTESVA